MGLTPGWVAIKLTAVTTWMGDSGRTGELSWYTNTKVNSAFHPFRVGKSSTGLLGPVKAEWQATLCDSIWQVTLHSSVMDYN